MSDTVIRTENLGKRYILGKDYKPAPTFLGRAAQSVSGTFDWLTQQVMGPNPEQILWALKDVSFAVKQGETLGIIGRNGAGKSTLLKLLARITEPTEGFAEIRGRIGSLLEVGTGMHPELTGRENIYMNATILGMTKREVDGKFDEIVTFSGIEKFIDTPVKRYSSGMRVRLGFAIAAHLEPEILIVDEVLAVGDAEFQRKCLSKMQDVASHGRTVLFVSHNMDAIQNLCSRTILVNAGAIQAEGATETIVDQYIKISSSDDKTATGQVTFKKLANDVKTVRIGSLKTTDAKDSVRSRYNSGDDIHLTLMLESTTETSCFVGLGIGDIHNNLLTDFGKDVNLHPGKNTIQVTLIKNNLRNGTYFFHLWIGYNVSSKPFENVLNVLRFDVQNDGHFQTASLFLTDTSWDIR